MSDFHFKLGSNRFKGSVQEAYRFAEKLVQAAEKESALTQDLFKNGVITRDDIETILAQLHPTDPLRLVKEAQRYWSFLLDIFSTEARLFTVCMQCGELKCECLEPRLRGLPLRRVHETRELITGREWAASLRKANEVFFRYVDELARQR